MDMINAETHLYEQRLAMEEAAERKDLRDKLAAIALGGLLAGGARMDSYSLAKRAYEHADAMLKRRDDLNH